MTVDTPPENAMLATTLGISCDPHGQAALLLVESLIHDLVRRETLTSDDAIRIIELAAEVDEAMHDDAQGRVIDRSSTATLLHAMASSLRRDVGR